VNTLDHLKAYLRIGRPKRNQTDLTKYLVRRPLLGMAVGGYEAALAFSNRLDMRTKTIASLHVSALIGCPF
jgi:hypothetical protein